MIFKLEDIRERHSWPGSRRCQGAFRSLASICQGHFLQGCGASRVISPRRHCAWRPLLNAYLGGVIDEGAFGSKTDELRSEAEGVKTSLERCGDADASGGDMALRVFEGTQTLPEVWHGSKMATRREILESVTLNRTVSDVSLCTEKRKPFDFLAKAPLVQNGTPGRTRTCGLRFRKP